jgi:hypothetical protein
MGNGALVCSQGSLAVAEANFGARFARSLAWQRRARAGCSASVRRSSLRSDCPALLGLAARRPTRSAHFVRYPQTAGDKSGDEARCARGPRALALAGRAGPEARPLARREQSSGLFLSGLAFAEPSAGFEREANTVPERQAAPGGGDLWGDEERRFEVGARQRASSTDSRRLFERSERSERSELAARPRTEHRSAVGAKRRPPHHEPPPGAACRDAQTVTWQAQWNH